MKKLIYTLIATTLLTTSAFAAGHDLVSTDGADCGGRVAGDIISTEGSGESGITTGSSPTGN